MSSKWRWVGVACLVLTASLSIAWAGGDGDGRALILKAIDAIGGEKNLVKHQAMTWNEKGTYYGMGDGLPYAGKYAVQLPSQFRMEIQGVFVIVLDGDKGWMQAGGETKPMTKEQLEVQINNHKAGYISSLLPLKDKAFQVKSLGEAKVEGKPAIVVQVTRKDYPDVKLYFQKDNNILVKTSYRTKAEEMNFQEVTMALYYSDHRVVDGVQTPHRVVLKRDDKNFVEADMSDIKAVGKLDNKTFAKPE